MNPQLILLVTVDCLRPDHLRSHGYPREVSPFIDKLAKEGITFTKVFANYPTTGGLIPAIFYSKYPWQSGSNYEWLQDKNSLQTSLQKNGYTTSSIHTNPFLNRNNHWERGFDYFLDDMTFQPDTGSVLKKLYRKLWKMKRRFIDFKGISATASEINSFGKEWIEKNLANQMFLHLHYMDLHEPYFPPSNTFKKVTGDNLSLFKKLKSVNLQNKLIKDKKSINNIKKEEKKFLIDLYDACLKNVDNELRDLANYLEKRDILNKTLIIITADHGQGFGKHGFFGHMELYDEVLHIPLIFWSPDRLPQKQVSIQSRLLDLPPTILDLLDIPVPSSFEGKSLMRNADNRPVYASFQGKGSHEEVKKHWCLRKPNHKIILTYDLDMHLEKKEFYDLEKDPHEKRNIPDHSKAEKMEEILSRKARKAEEKVKIRKKVEKVKERL